MYKTISLQVGMTFVAMALAGAFVGTRGMVSAGLAGLVCVVPNLWFALHLARGARTPESAAARFLVGEFVKVAASCVLLLAAIRLYPEMHWPSLLLGMVLVLQSCFLACLQAPWKRS
ncbi:MAG: ATP synthase subunit I [Zoogloeaceae bacterium]|jgi:ATP synthase protein I|nr:ATP synthase subunit I [Zoogloeaceae bacterium]